MISRNIIIGWTCFIGWAFLKGLVDVQESGASDVAFAVALFVSSITHFAVWALVAMPTYMISRLFQKKRQAPPPPPIVASAGNELAELRREVG